MFLKRHRFFLVAEQRASACFYMETERLNIRLYREDEKQYVINLFTDADVMRHVDNGVVSTETAEALWKKLIEDFYPTGITTIFGVFCKDDDRYIGHCSIRPRPKKPDEWEIGYILAKKEWGKGFATEIASRLIAFGFDELKLPEIFATIDDDNSDSIKVAEKVGMKFAHHEYDEQGRFSVYIVKAENHMV